MKQIERAIVEALTAEGSEGRVSVRVLSRNKDGIVRDRVESTKNDARYYLYDTMLAHLYEVNGKRYLSLGARGGAYRTATTKGRINAIARAFYKYTESVYQQDYIWHWTDGCDYEGTRTFALY